ncbi:MAG TPA: 30S ribosomal protein S16 [Cyclobacteriaceae bacterium]|nr:30S ribosomal protein S16 [Cyclobacteriaceae bacterium]
MAVKIRLARRGRKKLALYDVVVADARAPRDGRFIEKLGTYNPLTVPATVEINDERAFHWIMNGAQPTDTVKSVLSYRGVLLKKHLQIGVLKGALTQEQADARLAEWLKEKEAKVKKKAEKLAESKAAESKARKDAETKVKEARAEAIRKKSIVPEEEAAPAENAGEEQAAAPEATGAPEAPEAGATPESGAAES